MAVNLEQIAIDLIKQIILNQIQQATSAQVAGVSSFAQQVANEQIARDQQTYNVLQQILAAIADERFVLENLIALCQQAALPVRLPATPPPGYGGASTSAIAQEVWSYVIPGDTFNVGSLQHFAGFLAQGLGVNAVLPLRDSLFFGIEGDLEDAQADIPDGAVPNGDPSTILPTDDLPTWLNRESGYVGWSVGAGHSHFSVVTPFPGPPNQFICLLSEPEFEQLKATIVGKSTLVAPVWPGLAHVTLGVAVPISSSFTVPGPMDGVIVSIASVPSRFGRFNFGSQFKYLNQGSLAFVSDDGQAEEPQTLGFTSAVYVPRAMVQAASCGVRSPNGATGTVTPWVRT